MTIAGSDSGGGAGVQADIKTFAALGVHGASALTCLTAQNPAGIRCVQATTPQVLKAQLETAFEGFSPAACKTGMLFSSRRIAVVVEFLKAHRMPLVVDPVMIATSGARLLQPAAIQLLCRELLPLATLVTPNLDEAEEILRFPVRSEEDLRRAARAVHERFGCAALVKGGHLRSRRQAVDIFFDGETELLLSAPFLPGISTHGTGCTYSAAITAHLALGQPLPEAVTRAKEFITGAIAHSVRAGRHAVLHTHYELRRPGMS